MVISYANQMILGILKSAVDLVCLFSKEEA